MRSTPNTRNNEAAATAGDKAASGTHSVLYANLLENYFTGYESSRWNNPDSASREAFGDTGSETLYSINGKSYPKMCVPNLILYNKEVSGGIVDSFEAELTWNEGTTKKGGTGNVTSDGTPLSAESFAYKYSALIFRDLFDKAGLSEAYLQTGFTFTADITNARRTAITAKTASSAVRIFTYYLSSDYDKAVKELEDAGVDVIKVNAVTFYYKTGGSGAENILNAVKDGSIYTEGVDITKESAGTDGGNNDTGGNGNTVPTTPTPGGTTGEDEEIC